MSNKSNERVWQFPIEEEVQFRKNGIIFFEECAIEMATRVGRHLGSMKNVQFETAPGGKWLVTGTVVLESVKPHA
jgi:hypothetical protein